MTVEYRTSILGVFRKSSKILGDKEELSLFQNKRQRDPLLGITLYVSRWIIGRLGPGAGIREVIREPWDPDAPKTEISEIKPTRQSRGFFRRHEIIVR